MTLKSFTKIPSIFHIFCIIFLRFSHSTAEFLCSTPDFAFQSVEPFSDYSELNADVQYLNINPGGKWPNGQVKYLFHPSLTAKDRQEVNKAFAEYHSKTCIRFELKKPTDVDYISIEIDEKECGRAQVCRKGNGYQWARFGGSCRTMNTILHELGHSLCLDHEHQRRDRDSYLSYQNCTDFDQPLSNSVPTGLYDYQSMMHGHCHNCYGGKPTEPDVPKCGMSFTPERGLSVLDSDNLNKMYECQGCFRHRWLNARELTEADLKNLQNFGHKTQHGLPLYPCRTLYRGQVVVGQGTFKNRNTGCIITYSKQVHEIYNNVEVLTIPGGLTQNCYTYRLAPHISASVTEAVTAAASNQNLKEKIYIAFGSLKVGNLFYSAFGKVSSSNINEFKSPSELAYELNVVTTWEYNVLTCSLDKHCVPTTPTPPRIQDQRVSTASGSGIIKTMPRRITYGQQRYEASESDFEIDSMDNPSNENYKTEDEFNQEVMTTYEQEENNVNNWNQETGMSQESYFENEGQSDQSNVESFETIDYGDRMSIQDDLGNEHDGSFQEQIFHTNIDQYADDYQNMEQFEEPSQHLSPGNELSETEYNQYEGDWSETDDGVQANQNGQQQWEDGNTELIYKPDIQQNYYSIEREEFNDGDTQQIVVPNDMIYSNTENDNEGHFDYYYD